MGPAASQISIKMLGTNGGGFFNANSSHPFENPTPLTNWLQLLLILLIPAGLVFTFGKMIRSPRQAVIVFEVMMVLLIVGIAVAMVSESLLPSMEGKEVRFGTTSSVLWTVFTSAASNGSVNAMISSLTPLASGVAMLNMMLGEVIFGGVGSGLYGLLLFVLLTVFLAGLLVGRTPEYLGKKIEAEEIKMVMIAVILPSALILCGAAISLMLPLGISSLSARGPHGLSEMVYAFTSAAANNGSAFAGLNANTPYLNYVLAVVMLGGRFAVLVPVLRIAGILAGKKVSAPSFGTFATDGQLFGGLLIGVIIIVGGLTFFPVLTLGPLIEHFLMLAHKTF
jgi:K+-transporting ATPase ATPase A chain